MCRIKLTDSLVSQAALPDGSDDHTLWDSEVPGLGLRIRPSSKAWFLAYRPNGAGRQANTKKMKLATLGAVDKVAAARKLAQIQLGRIAQGVDPLEERAQLRMRDRCRLSELLDRYEADLERRRYVNRKMVMSTLRGRLAALLSRDITTVTGAEYAKVIEGIRAVGLNGAADSFRTLCRAFLTWCVTGAKVLTTNPLAGHRKERATRADRVEKVVKGRALSDAELVRIWHAADPATTIGRLIRFLILTGCRRGEGAGVTWAMVDERIDVLDLPAIFTKQGRGHKAPIAPQLRAIMDTCVRDARSELLFPSPKTGNEMNGWSKLVKALRASSGVNFNLHDLRRTFRTGLSKLGIDADTAELAIGHAREDLEALYNRDDAIPKIRAAFTAWANHVEALADSGPTLRVAA
ncbi:integrase arm-type DNA-binding domain-containing protein [Methylobacterium sp. Leaf466]|uniref:tyrosine-type recombinase/integrase n=1 Tax=Methylobacterium sp. Leaf466 TaxID=1736386 RepID=UPI000AA645C9|nr:integrase arm-type DNA-binding domain-containing protein [Methylobacterium sp. Leaf466]